MVERQCSFKRWIPLLGFCHCVIDLDCYVIRAGIFDQIRPTRLFIEIEDILSIVERRLLNKCFDIAILLFYLLASLLEFVASKLQENETDNGIAGLLHASDTTQGNAALPKSVFESQFLFLCCFRHVYSPFLSSSIRHILTNVLNPIPRIAPASLAASRRFLGSRIDIAVGSPSARYC